MDIIVGGGRFGLKAAEYLISQGRDFILLDSNPNCEAAKKLGIKVYDAGAEKLAEIAERVSPDWIFPTASVHVVAEAVKDYFEPWNEAIDFILSGVPSRLIVSVGKGGIILSYNRDKTCIENCVSPEICPVTKIKRPCPMSEIIRFAYPEAMVLISHQIAPGLGAIRGFDFLETVRRAKEKEKVVLATACDCHAVITALKRKRI
ncbi:MAG: NAD-binding protein [Archaeoglobi archaeon]|jgi:voltage-gated potassium channel Kch|nr:NAD-binding protein [Archaeoglobi archaeon]